MVESMMAQTRAFNFYNHTRSDAQAYINGTRKKKKEIGRMPAKKSLILVAESDPQALRLLTRCLYSEGYEVSPIKDEQQLLEALETKEPDLVLLDTTPSESQGFELCRRLRNCSLVPIIVISTGKQGHDEASALDSGADAYVTKPFRVAELLAQVRAILRRIQWNTSGYLCNLYPVLTFDNLAVDFLQHRVTRDGRTIALTTIEYRLLSYLAQNAGRILSHNLLLEKVWGKEYLGENNLLKVCINRLRHKIEPDPSYPRYIITRTGLGYLIPTQPAIYLPGAESAKVNGNVVSHIV
jgi:DNA-binding response OmpR family regulator